jgi:hypothetical protein
MPERADADGAPIPLAPLLLAPISAELGIVAALVAAAPRLNPSRSACSRMRNRLLEALSVHPEHACCLHPGGPAAPGPRRVPRVNR